MDENKENEIQAELESSADADPISEDQETDRDSESSDDTQKESENETSNIDPESPNDSSEDESGSETADDIKTEQELSEIEVTDQQAQEKSETAEAFEGQGGEKSDVSESDDASNDGDTAAPQEVDQSDDSVASDDAETSSKDEDQDSAAEKQDDAENDDTEKDPSEQQPNDAEGETEDLPELEPQKKIPWVKAALTAIVVAAVFSGFFIFENKSNIKAARKSKSKEVEGAVASKASYQKTKPTIQPDDPNYIYYAKIKEVSLLRETLLRKKEEIGQLKKYYQEGIAELEKEIFDEMRSAKTDSFLQALENKRIEFGLRTIQRRHAYMRQLDRPSEWIYKACEELLYLKRRATVDLQVAEVARGIDLNMHMRHMSTAIEKYRPTADRLAVDMTDAQLEPLENVWEQIQTRNLQISNSHASSKNRVISEQVCSGTFKRVTELSEISVEAAKCVAEMPGSDLFLNDLSEISPRAAKYLFQWNGSWLCLNGFKALSPRVANYLFQWDGVWISLNGLTEFPAEIGQILLQWQGKQLELMGLRYTPSSFDNIGIEYLVQWERLGGKLFVPQAVREKIDELKGHSA
jgi:hypothetical protein